MEVSLQILIFSSSCAKPRRLLFRSVDGCNPEWMMDEWPPIKCSRFDDERLDSDERCYSKVVEIVSNCAVASTRAK